MMKPKRIFILDGHPAETSLSNTFAETYAESARISGHEVKVIHLHDLIFDMDFGHSRYSEAKPLESDLEQVLESLEWSQHVVLAAPMWWGGLPAKLKGLIDRVLLPGRAFDTRNKQYGFPTPMLSGRSARVILTSDTPAWLMRFYYKNALFWQLRGQIFGYVGIKPSRITHFSSASRPKPHLLDRWIKTVKRIGAKAS